MNILTEITLCLHRFWPKGAPGGDEAIAWRELLEKGREIAFSSIAGDEGIGGIARGKVPLIE